MTIKRDAKGRFVSTKPKSSAAAAKKKAVKTKTKTKTKKSTVKPKVASKAAKTVKKKTVKKSVKKQPKGCDGLFSCESWVESVPAPKRKIPIKKTKKKTTVQSVKSRAKPTTKTKTQDIDLIELSAAGWKKIGQSIKDRPRERIEGLPKDKITLNVPISRGMFKDEYEKGREKAIERRERKEEKKEKKRREKVEKPRAERMTMKERYKSEKERRRKVAEGFYGSEEVYEESKAKRDKMIEQLHKRMEYEESEKQKAKEKKDNELDIILDYDKLSEYRERTKQQKKASENLDKLEYLKLKEKPVVYSPQPEKPKTEGPKVTRSVLEKVREKESN